MSLSELDFQKYQQECEKIHEALSIYISSKGKDVERILAYENEKLPTTFGGGGYIGIQNLFAQRVQNKINYVKSYISTFTQPDENTGDKIENLVNNYVILKSVRFTKKGVQISGPEIEDICNKS